MRSLFGAGLIVYSRFSNPSLVKDPGMSWTALRGCPDSFVTHAVNMTLSPAITVSLSAP